MSQSFHQSPSQQMALSDPYVAYCFDEAVYTWGLHVKNELAQAKGNSEEARAAARQRILTRLLGSGDTNTPGTFRDPAAMT